MTNTKLIQQNLMCRRFTAAFVAFCLIAGNFGTGLSSVHASEASTERPLLSSNQLEDIKLPARFGTIEKISSSAGPQVILIQDAHDIPDAQKNIAKIIDYLSSRYGIRRVAVEGSSGKFETGFFESYPDRKRLKEVVEKYLERGEMPGAVAAALMSETRDEGRKTRDRVHRLSFAGVEEWPLYEEGLRLYQKAMAHEDELLSQLQVEKSNLEAQKQNQYSKSLFAADQQIEAFYRNDSKLIDTLNALQAFNPLKESLATLVALSKETAPSSVVEIQENALRIKALLKKETGSSDQKKFEAQYQSFRSETMSPSRFARYLKDLAQRRKWTLRFSKGLHVLAAQEKTLKDLQGSELISQLANYFDETMTLLIRKESNPDAIKILNQKTQELRLIEKMIRLELTSEDWNKVRHSAQRRAQSEESEGSGDAMPFALSALLRPHFEFYANSEKRERAMMKNFLYPRVQGTGYRVQEPEHQLNPEPRTLHPVILVAGGFHADGLARCFQREGIPFVKILPKIDHIPEHDFYRDHMRGEVSWKKYFRAENGRINLYDAFVRGMRDQLIEHKSAGTQEHMTGAPVASAPVLKLWRDQILRDLADQNRLSESKKYTRFLDEISGKSKTQKDSHDPRSKVLEFTAGLRSLQNAGKLTDDGILRLLQSMHIPSLGPNLVPGASVQENLFARSEMRSPGNSRQERLSRETEQLQQFASKLHEQCESEKMKIWGHAAEGSFEAKMQQTAGIYDRALQHLHEKLKQIWPRAASRVAFVAWGSYARRELNEFSDQDSCVFHNFDFSKASDKDVFQRIHGALASLFPKNRIGHEDGLRKVPLQRPSEGRTKHVYEMLESRFVAGNQGIFDGVMKKFDAQVLSPEARPQLLRYILKGWNAMYFKAGGLSGVQKLQPDLKDGIGGTRFFDYVRWAGIAFFGKRSADPLPDLVREGIIKDEELKRAKQAFLFIMRIRQAHRRVNRLAAQNGRLQTGLYERLAVSLGYQRPRFGRPIGPEKDMSPEGQLLRDVDLHTKEIFLFSVKVIRRILDRNPVPDEPILDSAGVPVSVAPGFNLVRRSRRVFRFGGGFRRVYKARYIVPVTESQTAEISPSTIPNIFRALVEHQASLGGSVVDRLLHSRQTFQKAMEKGSFEESIQGDFASLMAWPERLSECLGYLYFTGYLEDILGSEIFYQDFRSLELLETLFYRFSSLPEDLKKMRSRPAVDGALRAVAQSRSSLSALRWFLLLKSQPRPLEILKGIPEAEGSSPGLESDVREKVSWLIDNQERFQEMVRRKEYTDPQSLRQFIQKDLNGNYNYWALLLAANLPPLQILQPERVWLYQEELDPLLDLTREEFDRLNDADVLNRWVMQHREKILKRQSEDFDLSSYDEGHVRLSFVPLREGFARVTVRFDGQDQPGQLAAIAGVFAAHQMDILTAQINTADQHFVDTFIVQFELPQDERTGKKNAQWKEILPRMARALAVDLRRVLEAPSVDRLEKIRAIFDEQQMPFQFDRSHLPSSGIRVERDGGAPQSLSWLEIDTPENVGKTGTLFLMLQAIAALGIQITSRTHVDTAGHPELGYHARNTLGIQVPGGKKAAGEPGRALTNLQVGRLVNHLRAVLDSNRMVPGDDPLLQIPEFVSPKGSGSPASPHGFGTDPDFQKREPWSRSEVRSQEVELEGYPEVKAEISVHGIPVYHSAQKARSKLLPIDSRLAGYELQKFSEFQKDLESDIVGLFANAPDASVKEVLVEWVKRACDSVRTSYRERAAREAWIPSPYLVFEERLTKELESLALESATPAEREQKQYYQILSEHVSMMIQYQLGVLVPSSEIENSTLKRQIAKEQYENLLAILKAHQIRIKRLYEQALMGDQSAEAFEKKSIQEIAEIDQQIQTLHERGYAEDSPECRALVERQQKYKKAYDIAQKRAAEKKASTVFMIFDVTLETDILGNWQDQMEEDGQNLKVRDAVDANRDMLAMFFRKTMVPQKIKRMKLFFDVIKGKNTAKRLAGTDDITSLYEELLDAIKYAGRKSKPKNLSGSGSKVILIVDKPISPTEYLDYLSAYGEALVGVVGLVDSAAGGVNLMDHLRIVTQGSWNPPALFAVDKAKYEAARNQSRQNGEDIHTVIISADRQKILLNPSASTMKDIQDQIDVQNRWHRAVKRFLGFVDDSKIREEILVNIFPGTDLAETLNESGAGGVGLTRTEIMTPEVLAAMLRAIEKIYPVLVAAKSQKEGLTEGQIEAMGSDRMVMEAMAMMEDETRQDMATKELARRPYRVRTYDLRSDKNEEIYSSLIRHQIISDPNEESGFSFYHNPCGFFMLLMQLTRYLVVQAEMNGGSSCDLEIILPMIKSAEDVAFVRDRMLPLAESLAAKRLSERQISDAEGKIRKARARIRFGIMVETMEAFENLAELANMNFIKIINVGLNDLEVAWLRRRISNTLDRDMPWVKTIANELTADFANVIQGVVEKVNHVNREHAGSKDSRPIKICFCGEVAANLKFIPFIEELSRLFPETPLSRSMSAPAVPVNRLALWLYREYPSSDSLGLEAKGHHFDARAIQLGNEAINQVRPILTVLQEHQEHYVRQRAQHAFDQPTIDLLDGLGGNAEFAFLKSMVRVLMEKGTDDERRQLHALQLSNDRDMSEMELDRVIQMLIGKKVIFSQEGAELKRAFHLVYNVYSVYQQSLSEGGAVKLEPVLHPDHMMDFLARYLNKHRSSILAESPAWFRQNPDGSESIDPGAFYTDYRQSTRSAFNLITRVVKESLDAKLPPLYKPVPSDHSAPEIDKKPGALLQVPVEVRLLTGWILNRELGWIYVVDEPVLTILQTTAAGGLPTAADQIKVQNAIRDNPALISALFHWANQSQIRIDHYLQRAIRSNAPAFKELMTEIRKNTDAHEREQLQLELDMDEILKSDKDITYVIWRMQRFGVLGSYFDQKRMPSMRAIGILEEMNRSKDPVFLRAGRVFRDLRSSPQSIKVLRLAVMINTMVQSLYPDGALTPAQVEATVKQCLSHPVWGDERDGLIKCVASLIWVYQNYLAATAFSDDQALILPLIRLSEMPQVQDHPDFMRQLYLLAMAARSDQAKYHHGNLLNRQGLLSPLAGLDALYLAADATKKRINVSSDEATEMVSQARFAVQREKIAINSSEDLYGARPFPREGINWPRLWPKAVKNYVGVIWPGAVEEGVKHKLMALTRDPAALWYLRESHFETFSPYYERNLSVEHYVEQLVFMAHLGNLGESKAKPDSVPFGIYQLSDDIRPMYEIWIGFPQASPELLYIYTGILFQNGFFIDTLMEQELQGGATVVRFLGHFPSDKGPAPNRAKRISEALQKIMIEPGFSIFEDVATTTINRMLPPAQQRVKRFDDLYPSGTISIDSNSLRAGATEVRFGAKVEKLGAAILEITTTERRGLLFSILAILFRKHGLSVKFSYDNVLSKQTRITLMLENPNGRALAESKMQSVLADLSKFLRSNTIIVEGANIRSELRQGRVIETILYDGKRTLDNLADFISGDDPEGAYSIPKLKLLAAGVRFFVEEFGADVLEQELMYSLSPEAMSGDELDQAVQYFTRAFLASRKPSGRLGVAFSDQNGLAVQEALETADLAEGTHLFLPNSWRSLGSFFSGRKYQVHYSPPKQHEKGVSNSEALPLVLDGVGTETIHSSLFFVGLIQDGVTRDDPNFQTIAKLVQIFSGLLAAERIKNPSDLRNPSIRAALLKDLFQSYPQAESILQFGPRGFSIHGASLSRFLHEVVLAQRTSTSA